MNEDGRETLALDPEHIHKYPLNAKIQVFRKFDELINYAYKNYMNVDSFDSYMHGRYIDQFIQSHVLSLEQIKRVTFYFNSIENMEQAKKEYDKTSSRFQFCLESEVTNRIGNIHHSDALNSTLPLDETSLKAFLQEQQCEAQKKQEKLAAESSCVVSKRSPYYLRDPVRFTKFDHWLSESRGKDCEENTITFPECHVETPTIINCLDEGFPKIVIMLIPDSVCFYSSKPKLLSFQDHLDQCHRNFTCEYCSKNFASANDLNVHKQNEYPLIIMPCALAEYGCSVSVIRGEMSSHYLTSGHQGVIINFVRRSGLKSSTRSHKAENDDTNIQLREVSETINTLARGIQMVGGDARRLSNESVILQNATDNLKQDCAALKLSNQEHNDLLAGLKPNQEILQQDIASLTQNLDDMQRTSYDGIFTWKVSNFREKMADAQSERQTSIYSPPFYSSPIGYKMRARLYLYGDGNARRTHLSLFFVLMRGEYDAILTFPFNFKVTFCLYDQTPEQRHIIDSFRPDVKSNSFQRPRSEMNTASGIPKFCPLSMIQQHNSPYVRDDTMFIKVMVDFGDISHEVLLDVLNIDPGLPTHLQHDIIRRLADEYRQRQLIRNAEASHDANQIAQKILHFS